MVCIHFNLVQPPEDICQILALTLLCTRIFISINTKEFLFISNLLFILDKHWHVPVFIVYPALHLDMLLDFGIQYKH